MCVADILRKITILCSVAIPQFEAKKYLEQISEEENNENNYRLFRKTVNMCTSNALGILFCLGHFGGDVRLLSIAGEIIAGRLAKEKTSDDDIDGFTAHLLMHYYRQRALDMLAVSNIGAMARKRPAEEAIAGPSRRPPDQPIEVITLSDSDDEGNAFKPSYSPVYSPECPSPELPCFSPVLHYLLPFSAIHLLFLHSLPRTIISRRLTSISAMNSRPGSRIFL